MNYTAPLFLFNAHLETIFPSLIRRVGLKPYRRERISTRDNDFLDIDWLEQDSRKLLIISHGLEGSSSRPYIKGLAKAALDHGYDVLAWNFRGCSGEINQQLRFYHSGATDDLDQVVQHVIKQNKYDSIYLAGFSLGGNLTLKYLGENKRPPVIRKGVVFSVPLHLHSSCEKIGHPSNRIYANRFLKSLKNKVRLKHTLFPELDISGLKNIRTLQEFDDLYTAPLHGFKNALDYYEKNSSVHFLKGITIPTLIINALNDPFLSPQCFPDQDVKDHPSVRLMVTQRGGHVGFAQFSKGGMYWSEERAMQFLDSGK